jgi:hypothetical protein
MFLSQNVKLYVKKALVNLFKKIKPTNFNYINSLRKNPYSGNNLFRYISNRLTKYLTGK